MNTQNFADTLNSSGHIPSPLRFKGDGQRLTITKWIAHAQTSGTLLHPPKFNQGFRKATKTQRKLNRANQKRVIDKDNPVRYGRPRFIWVTKPSTIKDLIFSRGHEAILGLMQRFTRLHTA